MPIYEFYCKNCNMIYNFWSPKVNTERIPACPKCDNPQLKRKMSSYAVITNSKQSEEDSMLDDLPIDESKMEDAIMSLASEAENLNEDNPRDMARLMRKFSDKAGLKYNDKMEEALARLESGDDPDDIEQDMDELLEDDELPFDIKAQGQKIKQQLQKPDQDETLYDLDKY